MTDWDTQKKALLPYLQRAAEIEAVDPKVAYYCRLYAVEQGIKLEQRDQKADDLLELVLNQLEKDKPHLVLDTSVDLEHCERFALNVYIKAKRRDEQGVSDRDTAKAYYAAFNFIEILKQFGSLSPEVEKERRFAVFRAAEIKRCLDEAKEPPPLVPPVETDEPEPEQKEAPTPQKPGGPPLIDYDPGYIVGSKILFMDGDSGLFRRGYIHAKSQEVGGFFDIQAEDGSTRQLGALFLAPDLAEGGNASFFFPDGRQMNATVTAMHASEWPPFYSLCMEDGSEKTVNHSQFILISGPVMEQQAEQAVAEVVDGTPTEVVASLPSVPQGKAAEIGRQAASPSEGPSIPGVVAAPVVQTTQTAQPAQIQHVDRQLLVPSDPPPQYPGVRKPAQLTPAEYYEGIGEDYFPSVTSPTLASRNDNPQTQPRSEPAQPINIQRQPGFEPDATAVQQATKSAHRATTALNFNDVDRAIKCLQEALQALTHPSEPSS